MSLPAPRPDLSSPEGDLGAVLRRRAQETPQKQVYGFLRDGVNEADRLTYAQLDASARAVAAGLQDRFRPGSRMLMLYPPGLEFAAAFFGCLYAGMIAVPAYPPRKNQLDGRLLGIVKDCGPAAVLTVAEVAPGVEAMVNQLAPGAMAVIATDAIGPEATDAWREVPLPPEAIAFLQYTSGSTAAPKGVMVSHGNIMHNERAILDSMEHDSSLVGVSWLPVFHDMGLLGNLLQPVYVGGATYQIPPLAFLKRPLAWIEAISRYRGTTCGGPNFAYDLCAQAAAAADGGLDLDLSRWQVAYVGAEPVRAGTLQRFAKAFERYGFRKEAFFPCYGLAEVTLIATGGPRPRQPEIVRVDGGALAENRIQTRRLPGPGSRQLVGCGRAATDLEVLVVEPESGSVCADSQIGEIWVGGESVARGYFNNPTGSVETFGARTDEGRGPFMRTGDLGFLRGGELFITGRLKDLIVIRGRNYYPNDVELSVEEAHEGIAPNGTAAFAVDDGEQEKLVVAAEVSRSFFHRLKSEADGELAGRILGAVRDRVALDHELQLHDLVMVKPGGIPRTSSGKIRRAESRELYLAGRLEILGAD
ncbi:MAG: fatty acyl-AMP ligase [Candidatus Krumholzibacteriia bacterium]